MVSLVWCWTVGVYEVAGSTVLSSGRSLPSHGSVFQCGEGVALVLSGLAVEAWKRGGRQWHAWSSRCVSVVSYYAPTRAAPREVKDTE